MTHGSCNFAPPKDLEQVQALLASKRSAGRNRSSSPNSPTAGSNSASEANVDATNLGLGMITENELREVEKEAERRLRPYACGLGDCQRRYKNMNGLRYHYQHSGDHGSHGLSLLAAGTHECLNALKAANASALNSPSAQSSPRISRQSSQDERKVPTPVQAVNIPMQTQSYAQQQPYGGFSVQQAQITYQQQQYAQQQRAQYQAQAQQVQNMGMYIGMEFAG
jgi:transcription factor SFP1